MTRDEAVNVLKANYPDACYGELREAVDMAIEALRAQDVTNTNVGDMISRQAAIALADKLKDNLPDDERIADTVMARNEGILEYQTKLSLLLSAQPTLYGYNIEHLELIARVLQKEDLQPERVVEALTDIGRIVAIVRDEFEETLRRTVEQCVT